MSVTPPASFPVQNVLHGTRRALRHGASLVVGLNLAVPVWVALAALFEGNDVLRAFEGERNLMTWFSSIQMLAIGGVAWLNAQNTGLLRGVAGPGSAGRAWVWLVFAAGFVFLSLDERFMIHEAIRDNWLKPAGVAEASSLVRPGDVMLYLYLAVGLVFAWFLYGALRAYPVALRTFAAALALSCLTVFVDALPLSVTRGLPGGAFWDSAFEEIAEIWAQALFLLAFIAALYGGLGRLSDAYLNRDGKIHGSVSLRTALLRLTRRVAGAAWALNLLLPLGLAVYAASTNTPFWRLFRGEYHPSEWVSTVQLLVVALVAWVLARSASTTLPGGPRAAHPAAWRWMAAGFVFFSLDERFDLHELIRDGVLRPLGWFNDLPFVIDGDVVLYGYFLLGLLLTWRLRDELFRRLPARWYYAAALTLAFATLVIDSLKDDALRAWPVWRFWDFGFEELGELWAQLFFLLAFLVVVAERIRSMPVSTPVARTTMATPIAPS